MALLAAYNFDEASGDVLDYSGAGRDWTLNTGAQRTTSDGGHTDEGLTKLGAGLATVASPAFGQTPGRTFMFWLRGAGNGVWVIRWYITADDTGSWGLYVLSGVVNLRVRKGGANTNITTPFPGDGDWHHYAGTYDGTNSRLYLDGTLVATSGTVAAPLDTADSIQVLETSLTTQTMDDLRIYDEALDQSTIATLMGSPVGATTPSASGTAPLDAAASVAATGVKVANGVAPLTVSADLAASGVKTVGGMAALDAVAALGAGGVKTVAGEGGLSAGAVLTAAGGRVSSGVAALFAAAGLSVSGTAVRAGTAALAAAASLSAHETVPAAPATPVRTFEVPAPQRSFTVPAVTRSWEV